MVNFDQLMSGNGKKSPIEPRALFQTLQREKKFEYLRDVQGDVLDAWFSRREERDLIIKMNTGSGKTAVGLVLLWSKLKDGKGPALYLCPDNYLVSQVRREAESLGIGHVDFTPGNQFPAEFHDGSAILITNVQKLFNGKSVFKLRLDPNPVKVGTILIDDAHTCINIAREQFTATFSKDSQTGSKLYRMFSESLRQQAPGLLAGIDRGDRNAYLRVPYWAWQEQQASVIELFSENQNSDGLTFEWPFLRLGEVLTNSACVISGDKIEVGPTLLPIDSLPSFDKADHRIYMSATLVDDAALIRDFGAEAKSVEEPIRPKISGDIGESLIISPPFGRFPY